MARRPRAGGTEVNIDPAVTVAAEEAPPPAVSIRMYRQGLGDCFLLSFPRAGKPLYMLIDCGVLLGTKGQNERMREIADDIRLTTDGHIDVLVATHEHWDHLSGFLQAADVFDQITLESFGSPGPRTRITSWPTSCDAIERRRCGHSPQLTSDCKRSRQRRPRRWPGSSNFQESSALRVARR
jgi:hypothetical protein